MTKLYIIGAGKYGREIGDIASQLGKYDKISYFDDNSTATDVLGKCADFEKYVSENAEFYVAFGDNQTRKKWLTAVTDCGGKVATIIHPTAYVSPTAKIGNGVAVLPMAVVNSYNVINDGCMINTGSIVDHDCIIGAFTHICVGAIVKADNNVPELIKIEAGAVIERETYK